jgi:hypothetical protein
MKDEYDHEEDEEAGVWELAWCLLPFIVAVLVFITLIAISI